MKPEHLKYICSEALQRLIWHTMDDCRSDPNNLTFASQLAMLVEEKRRRGL